jgi:hypothetical protein
MIQKHEITFLKESLPRLIEHFIRLYILRDILEITFYQDDKKCDVFIDNKLQVTTKVFSDVDFEIVKKMLLDGGITVAVKSETGRKEMILCL